jgi:hypothetical protein
MRHFNCFDVQIAWLLPCFLGSPEGVLRLCMLCQSTVLCAMMTGTI